MKWILAFAGLLLLQAGHAQHGMHHRFEDAERWSKVFDDPERDAWQKPAEVIRALRLAPQAKVADIGAGTGYFATRLARAVPQGRVYGADLEPDMVKFLNERAAREKLPNLSAHQAAADDPQLPEKVDLALLVDAYHHIDERTRYFSAMKKYLAPNGRIAIVDFKLDSPVGPPKRHRLAAGKVKDEMAKAGFRLVEEHGFLPYQYLLVFTAAS